MADTSLTHDARSLLLSEYHGVLSTHSVDQAGYPFGSVVPYCLDREGRPLILISTIAQHTKNIAADNRVSLLVSQGEVDDVQAAPRLTWLGDAEKVPEDELAVSERYYRFFPDARGYHKTHDFMFYRINLVRGRYIGGFGKIRWVDAEGLQQANPLQAEEEFRAVDHMNDDHRDALVKYCQQQGWPLAEGVEPLMVGIEQAGFHLLLGERVALVPFAEPVATMGDVRQALVAMARA